MNMKWFVRIVVLVALLLLGALGWQWLAADPGFLQLRIRGYVLETTVVVAVAALLLALATLWLLLRLLRLPLQWLAGRRARRTRHAFAQAELRLREGQWARAEKQFLRAADDADFRIPALLEAAQCAHARGDAAQAQAHLLRLDDEAEGRRLAQLERAREALVGDRPEEALGLLASVDPLPPSAIGLRIDALRASHRSAEALAELPLLHKAQLHDGLQFAKLELATTRQALAEAGTGAALEQAWNQLPRGHKRSADLVAAYVERGLTLGLQDGAALIEAQLRHEWSEPLVRLYGRLDQPAPSQRLKLAEGWLAAHPDSVGLNLTLGRLQQRLGQPRLSEDYLGHALALASDAEAWEALAELYGQQQLAERAHVAAINALRARRGEAPLPLPAGPARTDNLGLFAVAEERSEHGVPRLPGAGVR
jgi:HemY protein